MSKITTHVKRGDEVVVISGNHAGKRGKILQISGKKNQVIVEGVHIIKKAARRSQDNPQGGFIEREGPIHVSNVMLASRYDSSKKRSAATVAA
jgi:large subunit ribosomal protein L24